MDDGAPNITKGITAQSANHITIAGLLPMKSETLGTNIVQNIAKIPIALTIVPADVISLPPADEKKSVA